jgi:DDE superfamily endonuclease
MNTPIIASFAELLVPFAGCFTAPSQASFLTLASAWVLACGPRTVTNLIRTAGALAKKSHDAYQYFFSGAVWDMDALWKVLLGMLLALVPEGTVRIAGDDTLLHHGGRLIFGAGWFRDAVRSKGTEVAYSRGHNWVILCLVVRMPLLTDVHLALPICARLRPKTKEPSGKAAKKKDKKTQAEGPTLVDLMQQMLALVATWAATRQFELLVDAAYASLAGRLPQNVRMLSRLRSNAALYGPAPPRTGKPGRPADKGKRLPTPAKIALDPRTQWTPLELTLYGERTERLVHVFDALWYEVCGKRLVRIVCVRDPDAQRPDAFFFSTDRTLGAQDILEGYSARWCIEPMIREAKQSLGIEGPQAQLRAAVQRQAPFAWFMLSLVKLWYLTRGHAVDSNWDQRDPWYFHKYNVAFDDMLACLRSTTWTERISSISAPQLDLQEILKPLIWQASRAA